MLHLPVSLLHVSSVVDAWSDTTSTHRELHWLDVPDRVKYKLGVLTGASRTNNQAPWYLTDQCTPVSSVTFRQRLLCQQPSTRRAAQHLRLSGVLCCWRDQWRRQKFFLGELSPFPSLLPFPFHPSLPFPPLKVGPSFPSPFLPFPSLRSRTPSIQLGGLGSAVSSHSGV